MGHADRVGDRGESELIETRRKSGRESSEDFDTAVRDGGTDLQSARAGHQVFDGILDVRDPSDPDDRDGDLLVDLPDTRESDRLDRRPAQTAQPVGQDGAPKVRIDRECTNGVDRTDGRPPARSAATARAAASGVFGVIFAITGMCTARTTAPTTSLTSAGSLPISVPYPSACGQLRFNSRATTPVASIRRARRSNSAASPPKIEPITVAPAPRATSTSFGYSSIPGFGRPIALSIPQSAYVSMVGFG